MSWQIRRERVGSYREGFCDIWGIAYFIDGDGAGTDFHIDGTVIRQDIAESMCHSIAAVNRTCTSICFTLLLSRF